MIVTKLNLIEKYKDYNDINRKIKRDIDIAFLFPPLEVIYENNVSVDGLVNRNHYVFSDEHHTYEYTYNDDNQLSEISFNHVNIEKINYQIYGRVNHIQSPILNQETEYLTKGGYLTNLVSKTYKKIGQDLLIEKYSYDQFGNIIQIKSKENEIDYVYDNLNRLVRENNKALNKSYVYEYDRNGNILSKLTYVYIKDELTNEFDESSYRYKNIVSDHLIEFNGKGIQLKLKVHLHGFILIFMRWFLLN